ncbi:hypothetical protein M501DRAFT_929637 [Patellaria atrata CBS 101060]|uniref:Uncharacterized protein n=1 Tax=Patellaria atrata CBS 101060 TaxID=1346257 RepID=A0A9P4SFJ2_9PEZI|nr:hypothetical protein M501DRAFT_929637 [Patellaria atrata CBS 101060]
MRRTSTSIDSGSTLRPATDQEIADLPHVIDRIPFAVWAVILAGAAERFTYFGLIAPWQNYMQNPRNDHAVPGALGLGQSTAVNIYNAFFLFSFMTPMFFAVVSDSWLGRYKTMMIGLGLYICGCVVLVITSIPLALDRGAGLSGLIVAMLFVGLGVGAVKATFFPFLGDQYVQRPPQFLQRKNGDMVIIDGPRTLQFIYNAYYWFTNIASLSSIPVTFLEKKYDFWTAYLLTTTSLCLALVLFVLWVGRLEKLSPKGNILPQAFKTIFCAMKSGWKFDHAKQSYQESCYGRIVLWNDDFVEEMKRGFIACRVIFSLLIFYLCINQMYNNLVSQAGQMNLMNIPNDMIQAFNGVACIIFGPIIQALYNLLAKKRIIFGPIARITVSFVFCGAGMAYAAIVQKVIYSKRPCYDRPLACPAANDGTIPNDVSIWIQIPVYFLLAIAEIFGFVTAFEYSYSKAPREMKAVVQALTQITAGFASLIGMGISPAAKDPNMVVMYSCLAGAMALSAIIFWLVFRTYDQVDSELNQLDVREPVFALEDSESARDTEESKISRDEK